MAPAIVDFECSSLHSDDDFLICAGIKELGKPGQVIGLHNTGFGPTSRGVDSKLTEVVRDEMEKYDGWITWNGLMFDLPFIDDRLLYNDQRPREKRFARGLDMMYHASWGKSRMTSRRLDWVAKTLHCPYLKTSPPTITAKEQWREACKEITRAQDRGTKIDGRPHRIGPMYADTITHCMADIDVTEFCYEKLKHRIQTIAKK